MDLDQLARTVKDLEYRVRALEKAGDTMASVVISASRKQFCSCGKDRLLCRAPDCPSHKPDPMGR